MCQAKLAKLDSPTTLAVTAVSLEPTTSAVHVELSETAYSSHEGVKTESKPAELTETLDESLQRE